MSRLSFLQFDINTPMFDFNMGSTVYYLLSYLSCVF